MKFINNYILEKLKVTSDTKINKDYSNMDINELINLIFPIEEHEDLWENCKWCIEKKSRPAGKNEDMYNYDSSKYTFIVPINEVFFSDGHSKVEINSTVRGKDLFFLTDIGNYSITYEMHGFTHHMAPDEHFQDIKIILFKLKGKA